MSFASLNQADIDPDGFAIALDNIATIRENHRNAAKAFFEDQRADDDPTLAENVVTLLKALDDINRIERNFLERTFGLGDWRRGR